MGAGPVLLLLALLAQTPGCGNEPETTGDGATRGAPEAARASWRPSPRSPLGTNLSFVRNFATALAFSDVFKESSPFDDPDVPDPEWNPGSNLVKDADGWVVSFPGARYWTVMRRELDEDGGGPTHYPAGDYRFSYRGAGTFSFGFDATLVHHDRAAHQALVRVKQPSTGGILLEITETDPERNGDYLREMSFRPVTAAGGDAGSTFNPWFLDSLRGFQVLRFMDWQGTNGSRQVRFADRTRPTSQTQASEQGVSIEHMVELANQLGSDPWFCIPHAADDDYVMRFARIVRDRLDPGLQAFVEYSNEVWNPGFEQNGFAAERGRQLGLGAPEDLRFYAKRSVEIFRIWEEVFGDRRRLARVLSTQNVNTWASEQILDFDVAGGEPAHRFADYLAVAPYFNGFNSNGCDPENDVQVASRLSTEEILQRARAHIPEVLAYAEQHRRLAEARRNRDGRALRLIAYEGGQHLVGFCDAENDAALTERFLAANRHPGMGEVYAVYLEGWKRIQGTLFVNFNSTGRYTKWGSWGFKEWYDQPSGPKLEALRAFAAANPRWWQE